MSARPVLRTILPAVALAACFLFPRTAEALPPAWASDPCAGVDCGALIVGVGQADLLPDMRISSVVAYAQAARCLSGTMGDSVSVRVRGYGEDSGQAGDVSVKDLAVSPVGSSLTKTYGGENSDTIGVTVELKPIAAGAATVYAQEFVDASSGTLWVRLLLLREGAAPAAGLEPWRGRRLRMASQDVRAGGHNEFTLWAEDQDAGLVWVEHWPTGGADLLQDGLVSAKFVFDRRLERWTAAPSSPR